MSNDTKAKEKKDWSSFWRGAAGFVFLLVLWDVFARSGLFTQAITPPLSVIWKAMWGMIVDGSLPRNAAYTLGRVLVGLAMASCIAIPLGVLMGRVRAVERFFLPLISVLNPIPSLALVPLFILWFGIGEITTLLVVTYAAFFQMVYSVWTGVRAVNPIWTRAALSMGANKRQLFRKVVLPGAAPYVLVGARLSFGRAWIAVIGGELLANPRYGLGEVIFNAKEFLNSDIMMASIITIGAIGLFFERIVFQKIEQRTVARWGMVATIGRR